MPGNQPEPLEREQRHLTDSRAALARMHAHTAGLTAVGGDRVSTEHLKQVLYRRMKALEDDPTVPLFFGRLDYDPALGADRAERLYVGRRHVTGEAGGEPLVIDWRAGVSLPFYQATPRDPMKVRLRRRFGFSAGQPDRLRGRRPGRRRRRRGLRDPGVGDRAAADRTDARHRGHHPARAGQHRPGRSGSVDLRPGGPGHRQDRGRPAPGGLPAVRLP